MSVIDANCAIFNGSIGSSGGHAEVQTEEEAEGS
jgi:hypothetical protein